ncbi:M3 family metallopeptidase [Piscinibacter sakaiensis]|uniref:Dipeptidyl carboxypeptidase Dcp n=1 Tax=Piscinibacter sakaiensis TaxID=1547922 RepID=A0A0K8P2Z2_PISS1|nr:M3 family metallopeptidase [Piscinibacter sakaiensis]GAP37011.1 dipeptidyl carboxypeptidase Dcp [Piscinibacter sakaiensis]
MDMPTNALLIDWNAPVSLPDFSRIRAEDFRPALERAMALHREELARIASDPRPPGFDDTLGAYDRAGELLRRTESVFHSLAASATSPELQAVQREMAGPLAAHASAVLQDEALFRRIDAVHARRDALGLDAEQRRLVERVHNDFVRAGAALAPAARARYAEIMQRLAALTTAFGQHVLQAESSYALPLPDEAAMAGLPEFVRAAARQAGAERGLGGPVITLSRSLIVPFLSFSERRDLREAAWRAWVGRGEADGAHDNRPIAAEILALRQEQARLLGYATFADYAIADNMAGTRERVWALLDEVWARALPAVERERAMLAQAQAAAGASGPIEAWDWRYWAEKVRQQHYALDEAALKPYFPLPAMVAAAFDCAQRLFGIRFTPRRELAAYHPDVDVYEVADAAGRVIGLFLHDNFARATKRSGAWMNTLSNQHRNGAEQVPVVLNNNNFAKAGAGEPTLLSPDDVRTLFHEFGHGLHGLLSDVRYQRLAGTEVLRDFVELPSQLYEHWAQEREVLRRHARHWQTGEPLPDALIERLEAARQFGQGYETVRYTASAIVDLAAHEQAEPIDDVVAFEARVMAERGLPPAVGMNHRLPHFQHLFAGSGYAAGYYVYLWAEVLDADAYDAFVEAGDPFDPATAERLLRCIYARGDSVEPAATYRAFRGRDPRIEPMLKDRGLLA